MIFSVRFSRLTRNLSISIIYVQECDDELSQKVQDNERIVDVLRKLPCHVERVTATPVDFRWWWRFHGGHLNALRRRSNGK
jgi:hypothetical protein